MLDRIAKPWFARRPELLARALAFDLGLVKAGWADARTAFGATIECDSRKAIGRALVRNGVYELAVSELLWRALGARSSATTFVDVGANVGYFSVLAAHRLGGRGSVTAFEPVPPLFGALSRNLRAHGATAFPFAVSSSAGMATLRIPSASSGNDGLATLEACGDAASSFDVPTVRLDDRVETDVFCLKIDVEGHEHQVLRGAERLLAERRVQMILFEEHDLAGSLVIPLLRAAGYTMRGVGWTLAGLELCPVDRVPSAPVAEPPNYVAVLDPGLLALADRPGWTILDRR